MFCLVGSTFHPKNIEITPNYRGFIFTFSAPDSPTTVNAYAYTFKYRLADPLLKLPINEHFIFYEIKHESSITIGGLLIDETLTLQVSQLVSTGAKDFSPPFNVSTKASRFANVSGKNFVYFVWCGCFYTKVLINVFEKIRLS